MNIALLGATGKMGAHFLRQALDAGHELRVLVRNRSKLNPAEHPKVKVLVGDATNAADVANLIEGAEVVVSCLGNTARKVYTLAIAFENILTAAAAQRKIPRCLLVSSIGCGGTSQPIKALLTLIAGKAGFADYETADRRAREESAVPCVLVRPTILSDDPGSGTYAIWEKRSGTFAPRIPRADVARFLMDCVTDTSRDGTAGILLAGKQRQ